jgi:peptidoglycan/xylan/chitin deacetylase (PgdA/CDA1 family)
MKVIKVPSWFQFLFSSLIWRFKTKQKVIYLTFDDGPTEELTTWILAELKKFDANATFFCIGKNIETYTDNFKSISTNGHQIGNHTFNHLSGWDSSNNTYIKDVERCQKLTQTKLFRPPYGRISLTQKQQLKKDFKIIMWDINCWDFDEKMNGQETFVKLTNKITKGSIVLLHDNLKSEKKLRFLLPKILSHFSQKGYSFKAIH